MEVMTESRTDAVVVRVAFEIHSQRAGKWMIEEIDGSEAAAIEQARQLYNDSKVEAVKVIRETYNPHTNEAKERVVYEASRTKNKTPNNTFAKSIKRKSAAKASLTKETGISRVTHEVYQQVGDMSLGTKIGLYLLLVVLSGGLAVQWMVENRLIEKFW